MTYKREGAVAHRPLQEPQAAPAAVLPTVYQESVQMSSPLFLATRADVEEVLSQMWNTPVHTVLSRIGGGASAYYAHDGHGRSCSLDYRPGRGYAIVDDVEVDYHDYLDTKLAAMRGAL